MVSGLGKQDLQIPEGFWVFGLVEVWVGGGGIEVEGFRGLECRAFRVWGV